VGEVWILWLYCTLHLKCGRALPSPAKLINRIEVRRLWPCFYCRSWLLFLPQLPPPAAAKSRPFVTLLVRRLSLSLSFSLLTGEFVFGYGMTIIVYGALLTLAARQH